MKGKQEKKENWMKYYFLYTARLVWSRVRKNLLTKKNDSQPHFWWKVKRNSGNILIQPQITFLTSLLWWTHENLIWKDKFQLRTFYDEYIKGGRKTLIRKLYFRKIRCQISTGEKKLNKPPFWSSICGYWVWFYRMCFVNKLPVEYLQGNLK